MKVFSIFSILILSAQMSFALANPAAVNCSQEFGGVYGADSECAINRKDLVKNFNRIMKTKKRSAPKLCVETLKGDYDKKSESCVLKAWPFLNLMDDLVEASKPSLKEVLRCSYTNEGDGGDEGYEVSILSNGEAFQANFILVDAGGENIEAKIEVSKREGSAEISFEGKNFLLKYFPYLGASANNYIFASYAVGTESGGFLCHGSDINNYL